MPTLATILSISLLTTAAAPFLLAQAPDTVPAPAAQLEGRFSGAAGHQARGAVRVTTESGRSRVVFGRDFSVERGPDVHVILSRSPAVVEGESLSLGKLVRFRGDQSYDLPPGTDLSRYGHLILWCRKYSVPMGAAILAASGAKMHK